jgi:hypothetical protein
VGDMHSATAAICAKQQLSWWATHGEGMALAGIRSAAALRV